MYITGTAVLNAVSHNVGDGVTLTNFTMDGGRLKLGTTGTQPMMAGNYNLSGGVVEFNGASSQTIRSKSYQNIEVTGSGVGNSNGNITLNTNGTFTVKSGGIFEINDNNITGTGGTQTVTVENGGIFRCGNNRGFNGFTPTLTANSSINPNIINIVSQPGSTIEYSRTGDQPITNANGLVYQNLTLSGSGNKTAPAGTLTVQGNLNKSGISVFVHNNGTVLLNGTNQNFAGLGYNDLLLQNGTKTLVGNGSITDSLKIYASTLLSLPTNDTITLNSDATKTARLAPLEGNISYGLNANFVVQRFIPAHRAWRFLTTPVLTNQTINAGWQEGATSSANNPHPGYGTHISGGLEVNGFDLNVTGRSSIKTYNTALDDWDNVPNINAAKLTDADGYMIFVRGSRANNLAQGVDAIADNTILRAAGQLKTGTINYAFSGAGVQVISNPYPSSVDYRKVSNAIAANKQTFYVWDPNLNAYNGGAFQTCVYDGARYTATPGGGSYPSGYCDTIQSGQAFLVKVVSGGSDYIFTENCKVIGKSSAAIFSPVKKTDFLKANLYEVNNDASSELLDGNLLLFNEEFIDEPGGEDSKKLTNNFENFAIQHKKAVLAVEQRIQVKNGDSIVYALTRLKDKNYRLAFEYSGQKNCRAVVKDNYLNTTTGFDHDDKVTFPFTINSDSASFAPNRFAVHFLKTMAENNPWGVVPNQAIMIYPNPVIKGEANLLFKDLDKGVYNIRLMTLDGKNISVTRLSHTGEQAKYKIALPANYTNQYLLLQVIENDKVVTTMKVKN